MNVCKVCAFVLTTCLTFSLAQRFASQGDEELRGRKRIRAHLT